MNRGGRQSITGDDGGGGELGDDGGGGELGDGDGGEELRDGDRGANGGDRLRRRRLDSAAAQETMVLVAAERGGSSLPRVCRSLAPPDPVSLLNSVRRHDGGGRGKTAPRSNSTKRRRHGMNSGKRDSSVSFFSPAAQLTSPSDLSSSPFPFPHFLSFSAFVSLAIRFRFGEGVGGGGRWGRELGLG
ncbi:uncharacterized protein LOC110265145 [Arachis ipaensis]|uniref:uncharacterized protein LOC110265145 n=1 Tax=Arachis ipaensis TaxID=130454 RepID=UPI000A2B867F|nr:uncharacterized protein LOC110265145 [Arachis ipaensis]